MRYEVILSASALRDIDEALGWFDKQHVLQAKQQWHDSLWEKILSLEAEPEQWPLAIEAADLGIELRELIVGRRRQIPTIIRSASRPSPSALDSPYGDGLVDVRRHLEMDHVNISTRLR